MANCNIAHCKVWLKMAESAFCDVVVYSLSALTCSHLTLTGRNPAVCEGFVRREGLLYVATDTVYEQQTVIKFFRLLHTISWVRYTLKRALVFSLYLQWFL